MGSLAYWIRETSLLFSQNKPCTACSVTCMQNGIPALRLVAQSLEDGSLDLISSKTLHNHWRGKPRRLSSLHLKESNKRARSQGAVRFIKTMPHYFKHTRTAHTIKPFTGIYFWYYRHSDFSEILSVSDQNTIRFPVKKARLQIFIININAAKSTQCKLIINNSLKSNDKD